MSTMFFGLDTWGKVGAVALVAREKVGLVKAIKSTLDDLVDAHASNLRAFTARYEGRYLDETGVYTREQLAAAITVEVLAAVPAEPFKPEGHGVISTKAAWWTGTGGGIDYNCAEDPQGDCPAAKRLDAALRGEG